MRSGLSSALERVIIEDGQGIRTLAETDVPDILDIERLGYSHPWTEGVFRDSFRSGYAILGLERDGRLQGYGVLATLFDEAHLLNLCVHPASRGRGYARTLLRTFIRAAALQDMQRMVLEVRASNQSARVLYLSEGFQVVGERKDYYPGGKDREDALVMACGLAGPASPAM